MTTLLSSCGRLFSIAGLLCLVLAVGLWVMSPACADEPPGGGGGAIDPCIGVCNQSQCEQDGEPCAGEICPSICKCLKIGNIWACTRQT